MNKSVDKFKLAIVYFSPTRTTKKVIDSFVKGSRGEVISSIDLTKRDIKRKNAETEFRRCRFDSHRGSDIRRISV